MYVYTMHTICFSCVLSEFLVKVCRICLDSGTCPCFYRYVFFINPSVYAPLSWVKFHWTFDPFSVGCWWVLSSSQYIPITGLSCLFPNKFGGVYLFQVNKSLPNRMSLSGELFRCKMTFRLFTQLTHFISHPKHSDPNVCWMPNSATLISLFFFYFYILFVWFYHANPDTNMQVYIETSFNSLIEAIILKMDHKTHTHTHYWMRWIISVCGVWCDVKWMVHFGNFYSPL